MEARAPSIQSIMQKKEALNKRKIELIEEQDNVLELANDILGSEDEDTIKLIQKYESDIEKINQELIECEKELVAPQIGYRNYRSQTNQSKYITCYGMNLR